MERYDIVFVGQMGIGTVIPFEGPPFVVFGSPVLFSAMAASCLKKRIAVVTTISESDTHLLGPMKMAGIDLYVQPGETVQYRVVFPTANIDERKAYRVKGETHITTIPPFDPCLLHLCCIDIREVQLNLLRSLKARGFRLSVDMQGLMLQPDHKTGVIRLEDVPEKQEILSMVDFVKLDTVEAQTLTGTNILNDQAGILEEWGGSETVITCSEGVLARHRGKTTFEKFTNTSAHGRMGRGDTVIGSYIARRLDYPIEDSLRFAAALASLKMESAGPFSGSLKDVIERMNNPFRA